MPVRVQIVVEQTQSTEVIVNTWAAFSATAVSPLGAADAAAIEAAIMPFYEATTGVAAPGRGITDYRPNDLVTSRCVVREILASGAGGGFFEFGQSNAGASTGSSLPPQNALVASLRTAVAGRSGRGRLYFGPFTENELTEQNGVGQWSAGLEVDVVEAIQDVDTRLAAILPNAYTLAVWSRLTNTFNSVTSVRVNSKVQGQERRKKDIAPASTTVGTL